ncbi:hypothetical protein ATN84_21275 [Paramesorhizobium deserti]|uniref:Uroporphyrin-III methyltransferase n=1 Tax=Paramesorhizobium deserti TaxID=1494590 RepID=A0A135HPQ9_9HYPH|nr:DUF488 domain-containing protein [Paramesorhizobium deserti]KXF75198.1 hypothetical protein ATN84_21275 [Paramesorhizobium deserti]
MKLRLKRVYEPPAEGDGLRVLVDRLWPRGLKKADAAIDLWLKEIAPTSSLRKWFGHDPEKWAEFRRRYEIELEERRNDLDTLRERGGAGCVTLLYGAKDEQHNQAVVLKAFLEKDQT